MEYEVEKILSKRKRYGKVEYLVQWKGYMVEEDTWEKEGNLGNAREAVEDYEREYEKTARRIREREDCHEPPLWLSPFLLVFSRLFSFLFIAWESLSHYVTQVVTMSHHGHGHKSRHMVTW